MINSKAILSLLAIALLIEHVHPANILFLLPIASKSHKNIFDPLISALAERNHNVTIVSPLRTKNLPRNVREIIPLDFNDINPYITSGDPFKNRKDGKVGFFLNWNSTFLEDLCHKLYVHPEIQELLKNNKGVFDLIILNTFMNACATGMVFPLQAPHVYLVTMPAMNAHVRKTGLYFPPSHVPNSWAPFTDRMTFVERVINFITEYFLIIMVNISWNDHYSKMYQKHLGEDTPSIKEIDKNVSMIMMNSHFSLTYPRPLLPDVVEIGGMHTKPAKPLPKDLDKYLSEAKEGFIYFSFGSIVQAKDMPEEITAKFLNVFSKVKQMVLWKWEGEHPKNVPPNVRLASWLPQQDILGHPNIKMFITHGGLLSTQEAVYHGVPLIGFPFFADQDLNLMQAEKAGFATMLEINEFTEADLEAAINSILENQSIMKRAKQLSEIFKDQPLKPIDTAVYWVEYLIKHKGAPHLRSAARDLSFVAFHSLDVIGFLSIILLVIVWLTKKLIICIGTYFLRLLLGKRNSLQTKKRL